jgi:LuxR family transcriptional regulator, maltose regulon positive regulatory protein
LRGADRGGAARGKTVSRPWLFEWLERGARVTQIAAPAGSGKTFLLSSWVAECGRADSTAWVAVQDRERDLQQFWISVADALRDTAPGSKLVRPLTVAPDLDGWAVVERLLEDLGTLEDPLWLVIDDAHELGPAEVLAQLELLVMRAPPELRFVLAARHDLRLGLHRLRLEGELTEIRAANLRFTADEARALFAAAGVELPDSALVLLLARTEGWAAGLRLAALSLRGHRDPEGFAAEFSGTDRTVAEYLLAEVLERQSEPVRRLLLRTSICERVNGELAGLLTGEAGGERILQDLEEAGAFVVSVDARRSWFRYHQMFADLLQLELRRSAPGEVPALHDAAAGWFATRGFPVEAVRHAQAAENWVLAARLLSDHWVALDLDGKTATAHELLARFPAGTVEADAELTVLRAADELTQGSLAEAERQVALAAWQADSVAPDRRGRFRVMSTVVRLYLARQRGDLPAVTEEADRLLAAVDDPDAAQLRLGDDLYALALIGLGVAEVYTFQVNDADRHLEQGIALARGIGRPYLELTGLAHWSELAAFHSLTLAAQRGKEAIEFARQHGWGEEPITGVAYVVLGSTLVGQGRLEEAEPWLARAGRTLRAELEPAAGLVLHHALGMLELARGRDADAMAAFQTAEKLGGLLVTGHPRTTPMRAHLLQAQIRRGEIRRAEQALAGLDEETDRGDMRNALAALRLAQGHPQAAAAALRPVIDGSIPEVHPIWLVSALIQEAIARDALGDQDAAGRALERALDAAEPDRVLFPFLVYPAPGLLERHARQHTNHAALIWQILDQLAGASKPSSPTAGSARLREPVSLSETRVLQYLPTNLRVPEIANQLTLSVNTIRTHIRHLYEKLGVHSRTEAVERSRALGLLAPLPRAHPRPEP